MGADRLHDPLRNSPDNDRHSFLEQILHGVHSADAIFLRNGGELGFGFEGHIDDLIFGRPTLQILAVVADRGQNFARVNRFAVVIATKGLADQDTEIPSLRQVQHRLDAPCRTAIFA